MRLCVSRQYLRFELRSSGRHVWQDQDGRLEAGNASLSTHAILESSDTISLETLMGKSAIPVYLAARAEKTS